MSFDVQQHARQQPLPTANSAIDHVVPPWLHFAAGASGGVINAIITSPLDVLRTRMQSDLYLTSSRSPSTPTSVLLRPIYETFATMRAMHRAEGWRSLFRGLLPSLAGVVPAQTVKFYAAVAAGLATATATNPIWLVKTRLQLDKQTSRRYQGVVDCMRQVLRQEGVAGMYRGLSASYLGALETVVHLVLYERLKTALRGDGSVVGAAAEMRCSELTNWASTAGAAGAAKVAAVLITYPHEVIRTRLRQAPVESVGRVQQTTLVQCCRTTWAREGWRGFYAGLTPHLVRSIPSAVITFGVYEFVLRLAGPRS